MRRKRRTWKFLILSILSFIALLIIITTLSPYQNFSIKFASIPVVIIFYMLLALFIFSFFAFLLKSRKHGILLSIFTVIYFVFRANNLTHPFFFLLLLALFLTLELLFTSKREQ
ncbi:MAG: hypothetical protein KatS3mg089_0197 [Patescibacteria group bacterium]|nr:MAG: hypothetical protein KatS3mg089_0197 [Patescibacteria group bacterium]